MEILRIVRMGFRAEGLPELEALLRETAPLIRRFPGCMALAVYVDAQDPTVYYTHSRWQSAEDLEKYRQSDLFARTWARTKVLFNQAPQAFSLQTPTVPISTDLSV